MTTFCCQTTCKYQTKYSNKNAKASVTVLSPMPFEISTRDNRVYITLALTDTSMPFCGRYSPLPAYIFMSLNL